MLGPYRKVPRNASAACCAASECVPLRMRSSTANPMPAGDAVHSVEDTGHEDSGSTNA